MPSNADVVKYLIIGIRVFDTCQSSEVMAYYTQWALCLGSECTHAFCLFSSFAEGNLGDYLGGHSVYSRGFSLRCCKFYYIQWYLSSKPLICGLVAQFTCLSESAAGGFKIFSLCSYEYWQRRLSFIGRWSFYGTSPMSLKR